MTNTFAETYQDDADYYEAANTVVGADITQGYRSIKQVLPTLFQGKNWDRKP